jgi:hexosaminidase
MNESGKDEAALCFEMGPDIPTEGYGLHIGPDRICVTASDAAGFFNGAASLLQLNEVTDTAQVSWPCVEIDDWPRFNFRGLMLDCARHFHEKDTILRTLDLMARYKLNHFHWHLTDDEGWRLEIQAFPELTRRGAWRGEGEVLEPQFGTGPDRYGGFYSRQDVRDVVEYAAARQIVVIPEIDIPGHSRAAIKSYPELLVESEDSSVYCGAQLYTDNVLNPALPGTYQFLHTVLDEVCEMFPGPFVHLGADEVPEGVWIESPACQEFLQQHHYNSAHELQGHLLRDLQSYLAKRGKQLMGWEEAVHGDRLDYTATVNAWSGVPVGTELANTGYAVVACAAPFAYLDLAWDDNTFEPGYYWAGTCDPARHLWLRTDDSRSDRSGCLSFHRRSGRVVE